MSASTKTIPTTSALTPGDRALILGAVLSLAVLIPLFVMPYDPGPSSTSRIVGEVVSDGLVRRRHSRSLSWEEFVGTGPVHLRDILYTPRGVQAEVRLSNGEVAVLPPDSLIQFDEVTLDNLRIALREKEVPRFRLLPLPRANQRNLLGDPAPFATMVEELSRRLAASLAKPLR